MYDNVTGLYEDFSRGEGTLVTADYSSSFDFFYFMDIRENFGSKLEFTIREH